MAKGRARAEILAAAGKSIVAKLEAGADAGSFTELERFFFVESFSKQMKRQQSSQLVNDRARELLPEVARKMKSLPAQTSTTTSERWVSQVVRDTEDVGDEEELRDLYARIIAGEATRPGRSDRAVVRDEQQRAGCGWVDSLRHTHRRRSSGGQMLREYGARLPE